MTRGVHSKEQFAEFAARTTIDGMILNKIDSLGSKERAALAADLPGADLDKLWLLEQGRLPESMAHAAAMLGVGVTILLGGGALAIRRSTSHDGLTFHMESRQSAVFGFDRG